MIEPQDPISEKILQFFQGLDPADQRSCRIACRTPEGFVLTPEGFAPEEDPAAELLFLTTAPREPHLPVQDPLADLLALLFRSREDLTVLMVSSGPHCLAFSRTGATLRPYLDDMAQIIGPTLGCSPPPTDRRAGGPTLRNLQKRSAVLLRDWGVLAAAESLDDALAICEIAEKSCKAHIQGLYLGGGVPIPPHEAWLMRLVYRKKYSRRKDTRA